MKMQGSDWQQAALQKLKKQHQRKIEDTWGYTKWSIILNWVNDLKFNNDNESGVIKYHRGRKAVHGASATLNIMATK